MNVKKWILFALLFSFSISPVHADNFLTVSDIHFDPFSSCENKAPCPVIDALNQAPPNQWAEILTASELPQPQYKLDTNYLLLQSTFSELSKVSETEKLDFVIVLGDLLAHSFKKHYLTYSSDKKDASYTNFVNKTMQFLTNELAKTFPNTDVYMAVGNNDSYNNNYVVEPKGKFFKDMSLMWSSLIKDKANLSVMQQSFPTGGYYAVNLGLQPNLRLIVLNTVLFSQKAKGHEIPTAAVKQLDWLQQELELVKKNQQKALLAFHIPAGVDVYHTVLNNPFRLGFAWQPLYFQNVQTTAYPSKFEVPLSIVAFWHRGYNLRFQFLLSEFASSIMAILPGHTHMDWFQILSFNQSEPVIISSTPGISPVFGNNPAFKVYQYSDNPQALINFTTYSYSLKDKKLWEQEYNFNQIYQSTCPDCQIVEGMKKIQPIGLLATAYVQYYSVGTDSQPITKFWLPFYWCNIHAINEWDYNRCLGK
jgi:sphingomyelin phosphodiesterase acid-like 3